ncbi:MAG: glycosyltransferase family 39 protein [Vicinamibacterales bacterium]
MTRPSTWVALLAALVLLAGASQLTRAGYSVDEEFTAFAVRGIQADRLPLLPSGLLYDRGLAYSYASWIAGGVSGSTLPAYRALSLVCGLISVALAFAILRRLTTGRAALLAAILISASLPFWATATTGRFYAPFLASYLVVLWAIGTLGPPSLAQALRASFGEVPPKRPSAAKADTLRTVRTLGTLLGLGLLAALCRWTHELAFTLAAVPALCVVLGPKAERRKWLAATAAVIAGLVVAQAGIFVLHYLAPSSGETMVRRFFLWQVLNLFEVPAPRQYGVVLTAMVLAWLIVPRRATLATVLALCGTAMVLAFSLARATNLGPLNLPLVTAVLSEGAQYPLDMFRHMAAAHPVATSLALAGLVARLAGSGGEWTLRERAAHLLWVAWVLWFGAIDSGITINYLLLPMSFMLAATAVDVDAIVRHSLPASAAGRRMGIAVIGLIVAGVVVDQWRGTGPVTERLEVARPTIHIQGIDEVRAAIQPSDRVACTDELGCLMLVGRIDRWLALDDFVRERFLVKLGDDNLAGVYTGAPAVFRPGELFSPNPDGTLPDRVIVVDVFKEYPIGNSRSWLPRAIELDGLQVTPLLETPQARVLQISPPERNAALQP